MRSRVAPCLVLASLAAAAGPSLVGCAGGPPPAVAPTAPLFAPAELRIHRVFTKVMDWNGDTRPDGIETLVELHDAFGDPTKGAGTFTFELYTYKAGQPDPRGDRLSQPWQATVVTADEQRARWSKTGRAYAFRLQADRLSLTSPYVFAATFQPADGGPRLFDQITLGTLAPLVTHTDGRRNDGTGDATTGTPPSSNDQRLPSGATPPAQ